MISKNSLVNQIKHNMNRRIWCLALGMFGFFITIPLFCIGRISQLRENYPDNAVREISHFLRFDAFTPSGNQYCTVVVILAAMICGITSFCYLNSKSQVDLYHSMPVSRKKLFIIRYLSGYSLFFVSFTVNLLIAGVIATMQSGVFGFQWSNLFLMFLVENAYFLAVYTLTCLAVIITGNLLNNVLMTIALLFGELFGIGVINMLKSMFFHTYAPIGENDVLLYLTPVTDMCRRIFDRDYEYNIHIYNDYFGSNGHFWGLLLWIAVVFVLTLCLFCKRPSEASGKAVVFEKSEWIFKTYFTVLITFFGARTCQTMFSVRNMEWFIFGAVTSFVLSHLILEILFRSDFKGAFKHLWHWGMNLCIVGLIFISLYFDWFHYDTYVPDKKEVQSIAVSFDDIDCMVEYADIIRKGNRYDVDYYPNELYRLENMQLTDLTKAYELVAIAIEGMPEVSVWDPDRYVEYAYQWLYNTDKEGMLSALEDVSKNRDSWSTEDRNMGFYVKYTLKNGKNVYRRYTLDMTDERTLNLVGAIYDQPSFKLTEYPILSRTDWDYLCDSVTVTSFASYETKRPGEEQTAELLKIYREELGRFSFHELMNEQGMGYLQFEYAYEDERNRSKEYLLTTGYYPIYPSFTETIDYLNQLGFHIGTDLERLELIKLKVSSCGYNDGEVYTYSTVTYNSEDMEKIQEIIGACNWNINMQEFTGFMTLLDVELEYRDKNTGEIGWEYGQFSTGETPLFVIEDMIQKIQNQ